jgi:hypothetical protein
MSDNITPMLVTALTSFRKRVNSQKPALLKHVVILYAAA